jgi:acetyltransferase-like isoleucine patch superfamily enzyme
MIRRAWYEATLAECGADLIVGFGTVLRIPASRLGDHCNFGMFNSVGHVWIGDYFVSAAHATFTSARPHGFARRDIPMIQQPGTTSLVAIGNDVWVGARAVVAADVSAHSVIGAGSVITASFPEWSILGGIPAKVIGIRP